MAIKLYKPTTPSRRGMSGDVFRRLLLLVLRNRGTQFVEKKELTVEIILVVLPVRHRLVGHKRKYRVYCTF